MTIKKPLVLGSNGIEELQSTDNLADLQLLSRTNNNASAVVQGEPVYAFSASAVDKARANAAGTSKVVGLVTNATVANGASASIQTEGIFPFTSTTEVDAIAGTTGGFTINTIYFLSAATAGRLTATAPSGNPNSLVSIGFAISTTELKLNIQSPILRS